LKNWRTTLVAILGAAGQLLNAPHLDRQTVAQAVALVVLGLVSGDGKVVEQIQQQQRTR
jgi:hypothetical protein